MGKKLNTDNDVSIAHKISVAWEDDKLTIEDSTKYYHTDIVILTKKAAIKLKDFLNGTITD